MNTSLFGSVKSKLRREILVIGLLFSIVFLLVTVLFLLNPEPVQAALTSIENSSTGTPRLALQATGELSDLSFSDFVIAAEPLDSKQIVGVYAPGLFVLPVIQQPEGKPWFVSTQPDIITEFSLAADYGSTGFLAHNTLAGAAFLEFQIGQEVMIILADGGSKRYVIGEAKSYQALDPDNPYSTFRPVDERGKDLSSTDLFTHIYAVPKRVVFQTCLERNGDPNWGRYFVIAFPVRERFSIFNLFSF